MGQAQEILEAAERALFRADAVRIAAIRAVEKAQEAVKLEAAGVAVELVKVATFEAAKLVKAAELAALEAFEAAALVALDRTIAVEKTRKAAVAALDLVKLAAVEAAKLVKTAEEVAVERSMTMDRARKIVRGGGGSSGES